MISLKQRYFINAHKVATPFFITLLMFYYNNFEIGALVYLALHGTYCVNWCLKELMYPDKSFDQIASIPEFTMGTIFISQYWCAGYLVISKGTNPHHLTIFIAIFLNIVGTFLHFGSDAQKYYLLSQRKQLITNGFFAVSRNMNYFGEILNYISFAMLSEHIAPFIILFIMISIAFIPNMVKKDASLEKYEEFQSYKARTYFLVPYVF